MLIKNAKNAPLSVQNVKHSPLNVQAARKDYFCISELVSKYVLLGILKTQLKINATSVTQHAKHVSQQIIQPV